MKIRKWLIGGGGEVEVKKLLQGGQRQMKTRKYMRKYLGISVTICLLLGLMLVPVNVRANPDNIVSITLPYSTMDVGATFTMNVAIDNITNIDATNYDVVVNPTGVLNLTNVTAGDIGGTTVPVLGFNPNSNYSGKDAWRVAQNIGGTGGASGTGYFAVLSFTVIGGDASTAVITLESGIVSDTTANEIVCTWNGTATLTIDQLEVTAIGVVGEGATSEGYITTTNFTMTPTVSGGTGSYTYAWGFGTNGTGTTTASAPSDVTYSSSGAKTISLTVTDDLGSDSTGNEVTGSATIYDTLVSGFSGNTGNSDPQKGILKWTTLWITTTNYSSTATFDSSTSTGGKATYTYSWDFNNDASEDSTAANPANFDFDTFANSVGAGFTGANYTVVLAVTDSLPTSDNETKASYITIYVAGDINGDLALGATDVTKIELVVAFAPGHPETFTSDANDDGNVNAIDITKTELLVP